VTSVDADGVVAGGQRVRSSTVLWGAGVLASPAGHWLGAAMDKSGKIIVGSDLSVPDHPEIFAIGDGARRCAFAEFARDQSKEPMVMPGVAQPAIQAGRYVAALIPTTRGGQPRRGPSGIGTKAISRLRGVGTRWPIFACSDSPDFRRGCLAVVHIYFLIGFANRFFVMLQWALTFLTKRRQVRVFPGTRTAIRLGQRPRS